PIENILAELLDPLYELGTGGQIPSRLRLIGSWSYRQFQITDLLLQLLLLLGMAGLQIP
ncbi:hypothetical protein A2U01_0118820, partial [Trifolium medium]|nr:hypothetical protein [Trifolium medium]